MKLRRWQEEALGVYHQALAEGRRALLWEATPGAGKTTAAVHVAVDQLGRGCRRIVVVVPTRHLKRQWASSAARSGVQLDSEFGGVLTRDFNGVALTYQQLASAPDFFEDFCRGAMLILDEVHHAGDGLQWGTAVNQVAQDAAFVLALTGTAFRTDDCQIPFLRYEDGVSVPDYRYSYSQALADGICRPAAFCTYGGHVVWEQEEDTIQTSFNDYAFDYPARRLRVALHPGSGWIQTMLLDAHEMLMDVRRQHPNAGALLVAHNQENAQALAATLQELTGRTPVVALSDDAGASKRIQAFTHSSDEWIVACNMVSEGVDIPRLRVGVYATTVTTKLYFRQFLGRITRRTPKPGGAQVGYCYMPADLRITHLAREVEQEQLHYVTGMGPAEKLPSSGEFEMVKLELKPLGGANQLDGVIVNGRQLSLFGGAGEAVTAGHLQSVVEAEVNGRFAAPELVTTLSEDKAELKAEIKRLAGLYHHNAGVPFREIYGRLNSMQKVSGQERCTVGQLQERVRVLERWMR